MDYRFLSFGISDIGLTRDGNEDSALISKAHLAVADGMGGHAGGEVASKIAIEQFSALIPTLSGLKIDSESKSDLFRELVNLIDAEILKISNDKPELSGMGTTFTALQLVGSMLELLHIGDSRCYLLRKKKLKQLSYDHTVMQELIEQGRLTKSEIADHPQRALLTQALMGNSGIEPVLISYELKLDDRILLCTDGLSNLLSDQEITEILTENEDADIPNVLVQKTKSKGAPDNVTVIYARVVEDKAAEKTEEIKLLGAASK